MAGSGVDRELAAMAEDLAALRLEDRYDKTRTRTTGALARLADFTRGVRSSAGGGGRSSGVSNPTATAVIHGMGPDPAAAHHAELADCLTRASLALRRARSIVERAYPVPELEDEPDAPCGNVACDHLCTGTTNDRIVKPKGSEVGLCPRCRRHWDRHRRHWPVGKDGRDVRSSAA